MAWLTIAAVIAVTFLGWNLYSRFGADRIAERNERRRTTSRHLPGAPVDLAAPMVSAT
jgi:hypothetical protein